MTETIERYTAVATVSTADFTLTVRGGVLGETSTWFTDLSLSITTFGNDAPSTTWTCDMVINNTSQLQDFAWREATRALQLYSSCAVKVSKIQEIHVLH